MPAEGGGAPQEGIASVPPRALVSGIRMQGGVPSLQFLTKIWSAKQRQGQKKPRVAVSTQSRLLDSLGHPPSRESRLDSCPRVVCLLFNPEALDTLLKNNRHDS